MILGTITSMVNKPMLAVGGGRKWTTVSQPHTLLTQPCSQISLLGMHMQGKVANFPSGGLQSLARRSTNTIGCVYEWEVGEGSSSYSCKSNSY